MPSILEIQIGLQYWRGECPDLKSQAARRAVDTLLRNGLIEEADSGGYQKADALPRWVKALTAVPFPVIE